MKPLKAGLLCSFCFVIGCLAGLLYCGTKQEYRASRPGELVSHERIGADLSTLLLGSDVQSAFALWTVTKTNPPVVLLTVDIRRRRDAAISRELLSREMAVRTWLYLSVRRALPAVTRVHAHVEDAPYFMFLPSNQGGVCTGLDRPDFAALLSSTVRPDDGPSVDMMAHSLQTGTCSLR